MLIYLSDRKPIGCFITRKKRKRLQFHFLHSLQQMLIKLLRCTTTDSMNSDTTKLIQEIVENCEDHRLLGNPPAPAPSVTLQRWDHLYSWSCCLLGLSRWKFCSIFHRNPYRLTESGFLPERLSNEDTWDAHLEVWVTVFAGRPSQTGYNRRSVVINEFWDYVFSLQSTGLKLSGVESRIFLGIGERYKVYLIQVFVFNQTHSLKLHSEIAFSLAVTAASSSLEPHRNVLFRVV